MKPKHAFPLEQLPIHRQPFDHITTADFLHPEVYAEIERSFPVCPASTGPTGFSYYWGDPEYNSLIANNWAWKLFFETVHSQAFVNYCFGQFTRSIQRYQCSISEAQARYVPYQESRQDKERNHLQQVIHQPHELYVRLDIHQGHIGYNRSVHVDHRRRLATLLIYFSDSDRSGRSGGELVLHERHLGFLNVAKTKIEPRRNLMVGFACTPVSFHSVPTILQQSTPRNFVQIQLSSSTNVWKN
jgi:2OG-Fe(II) oxygenase superfamily